MPIRLVFAPSIYDFALDNALDNNGMRSRWFYLRVMSLSVRPSVRIFLAYLSEKLGLRWPIGYSVGFKIGIKISLVVLFCRQVDVGIPESAHEQSSRPER